ncbi:YhdT family protein [Moraxella sp. VT-16-12]|uniref:YhdT family protein n=1 Tax=Moraxella sp. VT-16-12 TaxID=2014877 RepID=UPI000B7E1184|nr:DUF997 family protein [Moraxella sp. VT-16-12]TWV82404.1 DUF997 family protein [Moraxella sp. VT-16-12]
MDKNFSFQDTQPLSKQLNREAKWAVYLTVIYLIGWVMGAYFSPTGVGVFGLPLWFELSCVFLPMVFIMLSMAVLKMVYQDINLNDDLSDTQQHKDN